MNKMKINLIIKKIHCKSCETLIKEELIDLGVKDVKLDYKSGKTTIIFDEKKLNLNSIITLIRKLGYVVIND